MADVHDKTTRSRNMAAIRSRNSKPEMIVRSGLHRTGLRFRLHRRDLPGTPDLVFPKYRAVVFIHGCFWHQHECSLFKWPKTDAEFWRNKINRNVELDYAAQARLGELGWRVAVVWECTLKGRRKIGTASVLTSLVAWITSDERTLELKEC